MIPNDFTRARLRLVALYLLIIASLIVLFSFLVLRAADETQGSLSIEVEQPLVHTGEEVSMEAQKLVPGKEIIKTEYEIENGELYFTVEFEEDTDVKGNLLTGDLEVVPQEELTLIEKLTDDFDKLVLWIGLAVFVLAALLSVYVANHTLRPIAENVRKQKQFVSGAAHELRNPLAALYSRIESALRQTNAENRDIFTDLLSETKRLIALSEQLLSIERGEERKRELRPCSVTESVAFTLARLQPLIEEKNVSVQSDIESQPLQIDKEDLDTLLYNLIHNAIKFTHVGGKVRIAWARGELVVADEGVGIASENLPHIFERFYVAGIGEGSGLGLALVQEIVNRYHGTMHVDSKLKRGTEFRVIFP